MYHTPQNLSNIIHLENQTSSQESSEPSQTKSQTSSPLTNTINNTAEAIASTNKDLVNTATTTGKDAVGSVADGIKTNAPEAVKPYAESLTGMVKGATDKAADLNQSYQNKATDGAKEEKQGIMGLLDAALSYIPPFKSDSGFAVEKEKEKSTE